MSGLLRTRRVLPKEAEEQRAAARSPAKAEGSGGWRGREWVGGAGSSGSLPDPVTTAPTAVIQGGGVGPWGREGERSGERERDEEGATGKGGDLGPARRSPAGGGAPRG